MGREQGDELGNEVVYVRTEDGDNRERRAYTPADHVNLQARGWVRRPAGEQTRTESSVSRPETTSTSGPAPAPAETPAPRPSGRRAGNGAAGAESS